MPEKPRDGWPRMDGRNSGRSRRRFADERRRDGRADFRSGRVAFVISIAKVSRTKRRPRRWKCNIGACRRSMGILRSRPSSAAKILRPKRSLGGWRRRRKTPDDATDREERRLHFQEPDGMSGRKVGRRTGPEKFARGRCASFGSARQFHRQRWRRDRGGNAGVDRENSSDRAQSAGSNWRPKCKSWGKKDEHVPTLSF